MTRKPSLSKSEREIEAHRAYEDQVDRIRYAWRAVVYDFSMMQEQKQASPMDMEHMSRRLAELAQVMNQESDRAAVLLGQQHRDTEESQRVCREVFQRLCGVFVDFLTDDHSSLRRDVLDAQSMKLFPEEEDPRPTSSANEFVGKGPSSSSGSVPVRPPVVERQPVLVQPPINKQKKRRRTT